MAFKATALVASALMLALVFLLSCDAGVEGYCVEFTAPDTNACREKGGVKNCAKKCEALHCDGGECANLGDCLCVKFDQQKQGAAVACSVEIN